MYIRIIAIFIGLAITSCAQTTRPQKTNIDSSPLQENFMTWWGYFNKEISLSSSFQALDDEGMLIDKGIFLKALTTGKYIPVKVSATDSLTSYQLSAIQPQADEDIGTTIKDLSSVAYGFYQMEGSPFPDFSFTDLDGNTYNSSNTKGKTILLKCWFIGCKPCVAEMPDLNELVEEYVDHEDILFLSLAFDSPNMLRQFLTKKAFSYAVIGEQTDFIQDRLGVRQYPTHFIIDEEGIIRKVVSSFEELEREVEVYF